MTSSTAWAQATFGGARLGDARRTSRLVRIAKRAAVAPAGKVTKVFRSAAERQAAYDLLESQAVSANAISTAVTASTARACAKHERVLVVLDGTSLTIADKAQAKGLGHIGPFSAGAMGVKLISAIALTMTGEPIGLAALVWWTRLQRVVKKHYRRIGERESARWRQAVEQIYECCRAFCASTRLHFVGDREADASLLMHLIDALGHEFTIRSNANRKVLGACGRRISVRGALRQRKPVATMHVVIPSNGRRKGRIAELVVRAAKLDVLMRDHCVRKTRIVRLTFVWARERNRRGLSWILATNTDVVGAAEACEVVHRYTHRWRIEDFHRTWKSGLCNVEDTQLRSRNAIIKWATVLAAVATRAEQLRHRSRTDPDAPAETILRRDEIEALVLLKDEIKRRTETVTAEGLTVGVAVRWIAEIGGWVYAKNAKPGATTIGRGLERVEFAAELIGKLRADGKMR